MLFTNFVAGLLASIMLWGASTNPVVSSQRIQLADAQTGEIISEWRTDYHWDGTVENVTIEP